MPLPAGVYNQPFWLGAAGRDAVQDRRSSVDRRARFRLRLSGDVSESRWIRDDGARRPCELSLCGSGARRIDAAHHHRAAGGRGFGEADLVFANGKPQKVGAARSNQAKATGEVRIEVTTGWRVEPPTRQFQLAEQAASRLERSRSRRAVEDSARRPTRRGACGRHQILQECASSIIRIFRCKRFSSESRAEALSVLTREPLPKGRIRHGRGRRSARSTATAWRATSPSLGRRSCSHAICPGSTPSSPACAPTTSAPTCAPTSSGCSTTSEMAARWSCSTTSRRADSRAATPKLLEPHRPLSDSRSASDRVTVEDAPLRSPKPDHPLLASAQPHHRARTTKAGSRSADSTSPEWDDHYQPVFETHDPGEKTVTRRHALHALRQGRLHLHRLCPGSANCRQACPARIASSPT